MKLHGSVIYEGVGLGYIFYFEHKRSDINHQKFPSHAYEKHQTMYQDALKKAQQDLEQLKHQTHERSNEQAEIFNAHLEILNDIEIKQAIETYLLDGFHPTKAIFLAYQTFIDMMNQLEDPFMKARMLDIEDVKSRLIRYVNADTSQHPLFTDKPVILMAHELFPSDIALLDKTHIKGIITEKGSKYSHTSIMIKSLGIPHIIGVSNIRLLFKQNDFIILDTFKSEVIVKPDQTLIKTYQEIIDNENNTIKQHTSHLETMSMTTDQKNIDIYLNVSDIDDIALSYVPYVSGVGLFRTEFMFLNRMSMPDEETQYQTYKKLIDTVKGKPFVIRMLDIGGDKILPYYPLEKEDNPFLGKRGIRLMLDDPSLLHPQLRAILRANDGMTQVMFPMITHIEEVKKLKLIISDVSNSLKNEGYDIKPIQFGVMIEVPSLVYMMDELLPYIDFASVGTNDLTQYLTAMDRLNPYLEKQFQTYPKVIFKVLKDLQQKFSKANIPLSICGELASDPLVTEVLIGLGYQHLSVTYHSISSIKHLISKTSLEKSKALAENVLNSETEEDILRILTENKHT